MSHLLENPPHGLDFLLRPWHKDDPIGLQVLVLTVLQHGPGISLGVDGGITATNNLRWVNTRGDKGPWSEATTMTLAV